MPASSAGRRLSAGGAIIAALPLPIVVLMSAGSGALALAACLALPLAVLAGGRSLWPGRRGARTLALGVCAAVVAFLLPYALGSAWAVGRAQHVIWAWPLVILSALVIGSGALWLLEGGAHHCET